MKYRRVKQDNMYDCAAACLLSVIRYFGGNNTMENIRYLTKCDKFGVSAYNLIEACKSLGFNSYGMKCDFDYLLNNDIKLPCIIHTLIEKTYMHYVVMESIDKRNKKIMINDPASGIKKYSYSEFIDIWTNIVIILIPIRKLDNIKQDNKYKFYVDIFKMYKKEFIIIVLISLISIIFTIINTYYFKSLLDNTNLLKEVYYIFLLIIVFKCIFDFLRNIIILYTNKVIDKIITINVYSRLISLPNYYFNSRQTGDIINRLNELVHVKDLVSKIPVLLLIDLILLIFSSVILLSISNILFLILLIFIIIYFAIVMMFSEKNKNYIRIIQEKNSVINSYISESIDGIDSVKNLNLQDYICKNFTQKYENLITNKYNYEKSYNMEMFLKDITLFLGINTILFVGLKYVNSGVILLSDLILFNSIIIFFLESLKSMFELEPTIKNGLSAIRRTSEMFDIKEQNSGTFKNNTVDNININNLNFAYKNNELILKNISINIKSRDKLIVVGKSGSGKSTLFKLLTKQYDIEDNKIIINNVDINNWDTYSLRSNICYISQNEKLFSNSLINNIVLDINVNKNVIKKVCKLMYLKEILRDKRITLDSFIEEDGTNFSVGEKQRIILARCLLRNSNVLILDEALNGLDLSLEKKILKNLLKLYRNKILIYITHRTDNIKIFNRIINFNELKERGNNEILK